MPASLAPSKKLVERSDRVKSVDFHPTEPWVLCALYTGKAVIYNYSTKSVVKSFDVSELPVRCAKFIARKQWIIAGSDDMQIRVFNYNTQERVVTFEGHQDYVRYLEVHPSQPYVISASDDMTAKLWDWEKNWACVQVYEGHAHYVMMARINPKDTNTFVTASLDRSIKVWSLSSPTPNFSLEGHERGVNCVDYYPGGDKPYIVSGADDQTLRVWDYQTRSCVSVLEGHSNNVSAVAFHARLPFILSAGEDGTVRVWHNTTYRLESTLQYGMERAWCVAVNSMNNKVAVGFDEGTVVIKLGREVPIASMDRNGKIIIARNNVISTCSVRVAAAIDDAGNDVPAAAAAAAPATSFVDGERLLLPEKELGTVELFPQSVQHNSNGRFVAVSGDNEFVIYTSQALRNKTFGSALEFVWSAGAVGDYAVRESTTKVKVFKNFKETQAFRPVISADGIFGGTLLCVRSSESVSFYDWDSCRLLRTIEVSARSVHWNDTGDLVAIATDDGLFVLRFHRDIAAAALAGSAEVAVTEDGVEAAFELQHEVSDRVRSGTWVGDCFLYTNASNRLNYYVGGEVMTLSHLDRRMFVLGYLGREGRVFLVDKSSAIVSFGLSLAVLEYQTAVVRRDFEAANRILPDVPRDQHNAIAKFLEGQGFKEQALAVADDVDLKFDLAIQLNKLDVAYTMLKDLSASGADAESADVQAKWRQLMDLALATSNLTLAEECALAARDHGGLLLLYTSTGDADGLARLATMAVEDGRFNIAFLAYHSLGDKEGCLRVLSKAGKTTETALFNQAYEGAGAAARAEAPVAPAEEAEAEVEAEVVLSVPVPHEVAAPAAQVEETSAEV